MSKRDRENDKYLQKQLEKELLREPMPEEDFERLVQEHERILAEEAQKRKKVQKRFWRPAPVFATCCSLALLLMLSLMPLYLPGKNGNNTVDVPQTSPTVDPSPTLPPHYADEDLEFIAITGTDVATYYTGNVQFNGFQLINAKIYVSIEGKIPCYLWLFYRDEFEMQSIELFIVLTSRYDLEQYAMQYQNLKKQVKVKDTVVQYNTKRLSDIQSESLAKFEFNNCKFYFTATYLQLENEVDNHILAYVDELLS